MDNKEFLKDIVYKKAGENINNPLWKERIDEELDLIIGNDLEDFILNTSYIILSRMEEGVRVGFARGSVSCSLVCHLLGITDINPLDYNLPLSRFLNADRLSNKSMPDIDTDLPSREKESTIDFMKSTYGEKNVYQVANFNTLTLKTAIKDISKALGINFQVVNRVTKQIPKDVTYENRHDVPDLADFLRQYPEVDKYLPNIIGLIKSIGKHAGAVVTFPKPIQNYMGTLRGKGGVILTAYSKKLEDLGFVKNDLLNVKTLDIIDDAVELCGEEPNMDLKDKNVYNTITKDPLGIFQLQRKPGVELLKTFTLENFQDLYNSIALIRPGAMSDGSNKKYAIRKNDPSKIKYDHDDLIPVLKDTLGLIVYQEQLMGISRVIADFTGAEADNLRSAVAKKKPAQLIPLKEKFFSSFYPDNLVQKLWGNIEASGDYLFSVPHSIGYAKLSYATGWLKTYYPAEFLISLANHAKDEDRVAIFNELKKLDVTINLPDINKAKAEISKVDKNIYLGLNLVDGIKDKAIEDIFEKRPFTSFEDFMKRKDSRRVNKRVVKALIESGALDSFGIRRDKMSAMTDKIIPIDVENQATLVPVEREYPKWSEREMLFKEYQRIKLSPNQNLIDFYDDISFDHIDICKIRDLKDIETAKDIYIKGLITNYTPKDGYGFLSVSDSTETFSLYVSQEKNIYFDVFQNVGNPVLINLNFYKGNASLNFMIDLLDEEKSYYRKEYGIISNESLGKALKAKQLYPEVINVGVIKYIKYFTSKAGNNCCWIDIDVPEYDLLRDNLICRDIPKMNIGDYIFFFQTQPPFLDVRALHSFDKVDEFIKENKKIPIEVEYIEEEE